MKLYRDGVAGSQSNNLPLVRENITLFIIHNSSSVIITHCTASSFTEIIYYIICIITVGYKFYNIVKDIFIIMSIKYK